MSENMIIDTAMQVILHAGNARNIIRKIGKDLSNNNIENIDHELEDAKKELLEAHRIQTDILQKEAQQENINLSVLFIHAQDTLMTTESECFFIETLYDLIKNNRR